MADERAIDQDVDDACRVARGVLEAVLVEQQIEPLARHFIRSIATSAGRPVPILTTDALGLFQSYSWPGNVRELRNVIERAVILCTGGEIQIKDLPHEKMLAPFASTPSRPTDPAIQIHPGGGTSLPRAKRSSQQPPMRPTEPGRSDAPTSATVVGITNGRR